MTSCSHERTYRGHPLLAEGLRLFFPAAAVYAIAAVVAWIATLTLGMPRTSAIPGGQWHAYELVFGTYGAALAGFLTSAVPEWTGTRPRRGRELLLLFGLWLPGRLIGVAGLDALAPLAAVTDAAFLGVLLWYVVAALRHRRSYRNASFAVWLGVFLLFGLGVHAAWLAQDFELAQRLLRAALMVFLVFLSLATARINAALLNLALDPSGETTPYRPHPGRQNLTAILVSAYVVAMLVAPQSQVGDYLALAAAAAWFDRLAEWFIGGAVLRTHIVALAAANALAGIGFLLLGLGGLGLAIAPTTAVHVLAVGSLGLAVLDVFIIAGLRHTGHALVLPWQAHAALALMLAAAAVRTLPELGIGAPLLGIHYALAAALWSAAFACWLAAFLPLMLDAGERKC